LISNIVLIYWCHNFLDFVVVIFRQKTFFQVFSSIYAVLFSFMTYYYYHLSSVIFCDFLNIFNESISQKSMLILDDKTLAYLWRIKFIFIYYFVVLWHKAKKKKHKYLRIFEKMSFDEISQQQKSGKLWNRQLAPRHYCVIWESGRVVIFSFTKFYIDISILALHLISTLLYIFFGWGRGYILLLKYCWKKRWQFIIF
jgi:hypothetical protein